MFHGLQAYSKKTGIYGLINKSVNTVGNEICCSDKPIGDIGLYLSGEVKRMYSFDCFSYIDNQNRVTDTQYKSCESIERLKEEINHHTKRGDYKYSEIFLNAQTIDAVWVKKSSTKIAIKKAKILSRFHKVPLVFVTSESNALNWA